MRPRDDEMGVNLLERLESWASSEESFVCCSRVELKLFGFHENLPFIDRKYEKVRESLFGYCQDS